MACVIDLIMQDYILYLTGNTTLQTLANDVNCAVRRHGAIFVDTVVINELVQGDESEKIIRLYEIPVRGAIYVCLSDKRDIEIFCHKPANGLVRCLGFDEQTAFFRSMSEDFKQLFNKYE